MTLSLHYLIAHSVHSVHPRNGAFCVGSLNNSRYSSLPPSSALPSPVTPVRSPSPSLCRHPPHSVALRSGWLMVRLGKCHESCVKLTLLSPRESRLICSPKGLPRLKGIAPPLVGWSVGCVGKGPGKVVISPFLKSTGFDKGQTITIIIHPSFRSSNARIESCRSEIIFLLWNMRNRMTERMTNVGNINYEKYESKK